jgi:citrate lyase subunit beta / citryl-CoA lyase
VNRTLRPVLLRRTWLFCAGADSSSQQAALAARPDVLVPDLEDSTAAALRPRARAMIVELLNACREQGIVPAVRVNVLEEDGLADLDAVMRARPQAVFLPKTVSPAQVAALDQAIGERERALGIPWGSTEIAPNIETPSGLVETLSIARASPRVKACLLASEDMAAALGAERGPEGVELDYARARFLVECVAAGVLAIDAPYTFSDVAGAQAEAMRSRRLGYKAKSAVAPQHVAALEAVLTPGPAELARARRMVDAFDAAHAAGKDRVELDGVLVEVPTYANAKRLLDRAAELEAFTWHL